MKTEPLTQVYAARIRGYIDRCGLSLYGLAKGAGIDERALANLLDGRPTVTLGTVEAVERYMRDNPNPEPVRVGRPVGRLDSQPRRRRNT